MNTPPAGIPEADWLPWPAGAQQLILAQRVEIQALRRENDELRVQLHRFGYRVGEPAGADRPQLAQLLQTALQQWAGFQAAGAAQGQWPQAWRPARPPWMRAGSAGD